MTALRVITYGVLVVAALLMLSAIPAVISYSMGIAPDSGNANGAGLAVELACDGVFFVIAGWAISRLDKRPFAEIARVLAIILTIVVVTGIIQRWHMPTALWHWIAVATIAVPGIGIGAWLAGRR